MVEFVLSNQVTNSNGNEFGWPNNPNGFPQGQLIPCSNTEIVASYWRIPQYQGNRVTGYAYVIAQNTSVKPTPDALKVLRVKLTGYAGITTMDMAILDNDNMAISSPPNQFAYLCDGLGGTLPVMPLVTIPIPMMQSAPQTTDSTGSTFIFSFPSNPLGLEYTMNAAYFNDAVAYTPYVPTGITTVAGFVTWANSNWSDYGTWAPLSLTTFSLLSATSDTVPVFKAGLNADLTPVDFCFDLSAYSTPALVNQLKFGSGSLISIPPFMLTDNPITLMNVLIKHMSTGTIFDPSSVANKLGINTTMATPALYNSGTLEVTSTSGTC